MFNNRIETSEYVLRESGFKVINYKDQLEHVSIVMS